MANHSRVGLTFFTHAASTVNINFNEKSYPMKKFLKITGISVAILLALLIILPIAFKGKIVEQVKMAINENVHAEVDFDSFRISLLRNFPDVSFRLNGLKVIGVDEFQGDTLASVGSFFVSVNLMSIFSDDGYEIKTIRIDDPRLLLKVMPDGTANWDIAVVPDEEEEPEEEPPAEADLDFKVALQRLQINNAHIIYDDREMNMYSRIQNFNHTLRGDFTADFTSLSIRNTTIESLLVRFGGIPYLSGVSAALTADIDADLDAFEFTFRDNNLQLNELMLVFEGRFAMPDNVMFMDFTFSSPQTAFRSFLSMVPAIYAKDFEDLQTEGTLSFNGHVKGAYDEFQIPGFGLDVMVEDGMFRYPDLPAAVSDVNINTRIFNPGGDADLTQVDVDRFSLNFAGNPVDFRMKLRTPVSDPDIDASLSGRVDLDNVKDFYPLEEGETLTGMVESNMEARGQLSSIENQRYDDFLFTGTFLLNNFRYESNDFPEGVEIETADLRFSPRYAQLQSFTMRTGESDLSASGRIDNMLGFVLSDEMLMGRFETHSSFFNLNPFMAEAPEEQPGEEKPMELSAIEVPANIDFALQSRFDRILFGELEITNARGGITIADQVVRMDNLHMNMLEGTLALNGAYNARNINQPEIDFDLDITGFDIQQTFQTFNTFQVIAPIGERASGLFSAGLNLSTALDYKLDPDLGTLAGGGNFRSNALVVENSPALVGLAENLKMDMFRELNVRDVNISFIFEDGRVNVEPFDIQFGSSRASLAGHHGFDQSINYQMNMAIPRAEFGEAANQVINNLAAQAAGVGLDIEPSETVNIGANITGTVNDPQISVSLAQTAEDTRQQVKDAIEDAVGEIWDEAQEEAEEVIDDAKDQAQEELERRAAQVIDEAEQQARQIRREAKRAADKIRSEAREQAQRMEDEASGPIAKAAARRAGQEVIQSADQRADQLENEADNRAQNLIDEAREQADRIRTEEE